jgi:hypothetical protein
MNPFGHTIDGKERPARRVTRGALGFNYGPDKGRQVIVSLEAGDLIVFRPKGTRQRHAASVFDLFAYVVRCHALTLAREKREALAAKHKERAR